MPKTKIYTVLDDSSTFLVTTDKVRAALALFDLTIKYEEKQSWFGVYESDLS